MASVAGDSRCTEPSRRESLAGGELTMPNPPIDRSDVPIRLFKSDVLEFFTHVHPVAVLIIWLPVCAYFLSRPLADQTLDAVSFAVAIVVGLILWTLAEYVLHRFVFHFQPRNPGPMVERVVFLFHGVHHAQPACKTRLVMPPAASIPMAAIFYGLFVLIIGSVMVSPEWIAPVFGAFILGYVAYDMTHYATHHLPAHWRVLKELKRHHMLHHYKTPDARFGVTSPFWDLVFGTQPGEMPRKQTAAG
jgi:sterol desaturase/sphingolipid hydroxylase (fatty acid hydroxylase superfamily)